MCCLVKGLPHIFLLLSLNWHLISSSFGSSRCVGSCCLALALAVGARGADDVEVDGHLCMNEGVEGAEE